MSLPVKKIFVDSKFKTKDSVSNSNFKFELNQTISLPNNTTFIIDDICIPHAWYTIEQDINDRLYLHISNNDPDPDRRANFNRALQIPAGNYTGDTLKTAIQVKLDAGIESIGTSGWFTVSYNSTQHQITIKVIYADKTFKLLADDDIETKLDGLFSASFNTGNPASMNHVLRNYGVNRLSPYYTNTVAFASGFLDLQSINNIYISSPNLGSFSTLGSRGESNIIKKVPVSSDFGFMIIDRVVNNNDYLECSKLSLKTIEFHLKDVYGRYIPLHNAHVSFTIVFDTFREV